MSWRSGGWAWVGGCKAGATAGNSPGPDPSTTSRGRRAPKVLTLPSSRVPCYSLQWCGQQGQGPRESLQVMTETLPYTVLTSTELVEQWSRKGEVKWHVFKKAQP